MKSENNTLNKFFIILMATFNLITIVLIIKEVINFNYFYKIEENLNSMESEINNTFTDQDITNFNNKYINFQNSTKSNNSLGDLINFTEQKTEELNLKIENTTVLKVEDDQIIYEILLTGSFQNIYLFIDEIEKDTNLKEVINSEINFINNIPTVKILIKNTKL